MGPKLTNIISNKEIITKIFFNKLNVEKIQKKTSTKSKEKNGTQKNKKKLKK